MAEWQTQVTHFVQQQGRGDPNVLRDLADVRSRRGPRPAPITIRAANIRASRGETHEVSGLLLGPQRIQDQPWYVFVTGTIKRTSRTRAAVEDVRLVAFTAEKGQLHWLVGGEDRESLSRYWAAIAADGLNSKSEAFPNPYDQFQLECSDTTATVKEVHSGASWTLLFPRRMGSGILLGASPN